MDRKDSDEFHAVRAIAHEGLRNGTFIGQTSSSRCRFVILPSFENCVAWDVGEIPIPGRRPEQRLCRSCWRMDVDSQNLLSPVERLKHPRPYRPTVEVGFAAIDAARIDELLDGFRAITIPLSVSDRPFGCDGTRFELQLGDDFCHARIGWWESLPKEWKALEPLVGELIAIFEISWRSE